MQQAGGDQVYNEQRVVRETAPANGMIVTAAGHALGEHGGGKGMIDPEPSTLATAPSVTEPRVRSSVTMFSPPQIDESDPRQFGKAALGLEAVFSGIHL